MNVNELTLDQLGTVSRGRSRHRPRDAAFLYGGPYPFVQTGDVKRAGLYLHDHDQTYSEAGLAQSKLWPAGTLCITIAANIAETSILGIEACFPDSIVGFTAEPDKADVRFVKYLFDAVLKMRYQSFTQGAAQDNLSQSKLLSIGFPVPDLVVQRRMADFLSTYDDLIENNRRRITLLERAGRELYREWFVRLRFPGHEHTKIADGVPEGWERTSLGNIGQLNYGKALKAGDRIEGDFPVYGSSGIVGAHHESYVQGPGVIVGRKGNVGRVYWTDEDFWPIDTVYFFEPSAVTLYIYYALQNVDFISTDVAVPGLNRNFAHSRKVLMPNRQASDAFDGVAVPLHKQLSLLHKENESLSQARDLLLPRLMSGEIAVRQTR